MQYFFLWLSEKLETNGKQKSLYNHNYRNSNHKFDVPCFMMDQQHGQQHGGRAAEGGKKQEPFFRNPPQVAFCAAFIQKGSCCCGKIDNN